MSKLGWGKVAILFFVTIGVMAKLSSVQSHAQTSQVKRSALIIGIAEYANISPLRNTVNDSTLIAKSLRNLGFDVRVLLNSNNADMRKAIADFSSEVETSEVALIYFAGHGMEFNGQNYLLPADISAENKQKAVSQSISLNEMLIAVDRARQLRIIILDSCRNDPFSSENLTLAGSVQNDVATRVGLASPSPNRGTLVAYAAEAGAIALDGSGINSPFAEALSEHLTTPNLEIGLMFRRVRDSVLKVTDNGQEPHTYGSMPGRPFFLAGANQSVNKLDSAARLHAWGRLKVDEARQLQALAKEGDTRALKGLAYMKLNPDGSQLDPTAAAGLLENAVSLGDAEAAFELARLYERGVGVPQNVKRALSLYQKAAEDNFPDAVNDLGFLHYQGGLGIARDHTKALALFKKAADLGHPSAMFNFAALIDDGLVPDKSAEDAALYLYRALRSGNETVLQQLSNNPKMFKSATRSALQRQLKNNAFYTGSIDGAIGPGTQRGLRKAFGLTN